MRRAGAAFPCPRLGLAGLRAAGLLAGVTYPSGLQADYPRDAAGHVSAVTATLDGQTTTLADALRHRPFGPLQALDFGNGLAWTRGFDRDGRLATQTLGTLQDLGYQYGAAGTLASIADHLDPANSQGFGYDTLGRLASAAGGYGNLAYAYDAVGNRLAETHGGATTNYAYAPGSQRLVSAGGQAYAYDAAGNTTQAGLDDSVYGPDNRLRYPVHADSAVVSYFYDGLGRRALKMAGGGASTRFAYGLGGELLAEAAYGQDGQLQPGAARTEHVWLDGMPIAVVKGGRVAYVHADHLGTPRLITDAGGTPVWRWGGGPFGDAPADEDPDGDGVPFTYNLRFPGQYFDAETGLHYNMARYYDPATGRYREADPIGLAGGVNLYGYVGGDPVDRVDPNGKFFFVAAFGWSAATALADLTVASATTWWWQNNVLPGNTNRDTSGRDAYDRGRIDSNYNNHSVDEEALKDMLENDTKEGDPNHPLSKDDADAALDLANQLGLGNRDHRGTKHYTQQGKYPNGIPHIHIDGLSGKLKHIPACP